MNDKTDVRTWARTRDELRCHVAIAAPWTDLAATYALHRLRELRAWPFGFVHPTDVTVQDRELVLTFADGTLDRRRPAPRTFAEWRDRWLLPLVEVLVRCHDEAIGGLTAHPITGGCWIPPVGWFLPETAGARDTDAAMAAAHAWLLAEGRREPMVASFVETLRSRDLEALRALAVETRLRVSRDPGVPQPPASFLDLLTEAELLERLATTYRYRTMHGRELHGLKVDPRTEDLLEADHRWVDPHFPDLVRPSPQELWDGLVEESRVTPVFAVSATMPNPLAVALDEDDDQLARWIDVHDDQPLLYLRRDGDLPPRGYVRLHLAGDNALVTRKRAFSAFAGGHPALAPWRDDPQPVRPFTDNYWSRADLEQAILGTRGVFAVQGPPGTGKTHLATEVVRRFMQRTPCARVLVCAKEHFALDHIARKIAAALTRDGRPFRAWRSLSLARQRRVRGEADNEWLGASVTRELGERGWSDWAAGWEAWQAATSGQHDLRIASLGQQSADLFFTTTMDGALVEFLESASFDLVIVEEAGKCYPSELLHALCLGRTALMIGDQRQLPPFQERRTREHVDAWQAALTRAARDPALRNALDARFGPLFRSLADRHADQGPLTPEQRAWLRPFEYLFDRVSARHRLDEQFRMEAPLSRAVGSVFYGRPFVHRKPELVASGLLPARPLGDVLPPEFDAPMLWLDTPHMLADPDAGEDAGKCGRRDNQYERSVIAAYLRRLRPGPPIDLVILTPYNDQKNLLLDDPELRALCTRLTSAPYAQVVRTTDEYQGREAELVILSLVRNSSLGGHAWGFMSEPERLNVMFSRARFRQVVVGCGAHIERHADECEWLLKFWRAYRDEARDPSCARIVPAREVCRG